MARFFYTSTWESNSSEPHVTVQQVYFVTEVIRLNKKCQVKETVRVWSFSLVIVSLCVCVSVWLPSMSNCNSMFHTFSASATNVICIAGNSSYVEVGMQGFLQNLWSCLISLSSVSFCQIKSHGTQELLEGRGILSSINDNIDSSHAQFFWLLIYKRGRPSSPSSSVFESMTWPQTQIFALASKRSVCSLFEMRNLRVSRRFHPSTGTSRRLILTLETIDFWSDLLTNKPNSNV